MKREIEISEWIESYLNGTLSTEDSAMFEKRQAEDELFAAEVERHREIHGIITQGAYLKIKTDLNDIHLRTVRQKRINRIKGGSFGGLILGIILLTVIFSKNDKKNVGNNPPDSLFTNKEQNILIPADSGKQTPNIDKYRPTQQISIVVSQDDSSEMYNSLTTESIPELPVEPEDMLSEDQTRLPFNAPGKLTPADSGSTDPDCSTVKIEGRFDESESCNNKPTGSIKIQRTTVAGGLPPYHFSIDKINFRDTTVFSDLSAGIYKMYARDAGNCISQLGTAIITSVDCTYQAVFAPARGETWSVPTNPDKSGSVNIFSRTGTLVYTAGFGNFQTIVWDGTADAGQMLPMGIYHFEIRYSDGNSFNGSVTIVR
jgi:hypothetical protein